MSKPLAKLRPPSVHKTRVFELLDRLSHDPERLRSGVEALRDGRPLIETGVGAGAIEDDPERKRHLEEHWIGDEHGRQVLARALTRAGELCLERGIPGDIYWVFAGERTEVAVAHNDRQVTVMVVTPFPDVPTDGDAPPHERIEIFR